MKHFLLFIVFLIITNLKAQTTYTWTGTGSFGTALNWTPTRTVPAIDDILLFDGVTASITDLPTQTIGKLILQNNSNVTFTTNFVGSRTFTLSGGINVLNIDENSNLTISSTVNTHICTLLVASASSASIFGTINFGGAGTAHRFIGTDVGSITFESGSTLNQNSGFNGNIFGNTGTANTVIFKAESELVAFSGANPFGLTQPASKVIFQEGSWFRQRVNTAPGFSGRTYANLEINISTYNQNSIGGNPVNIDTLKITSAATFTFGFTNTLNINKAYIQNAGTLNNTSNSTNFKGDLIINGGTLNQNSTVTFDGTVIQNINRNGSGNLNFGATCPSVTFDNAAGFTSNTNLTIPNLLILTNGKIDMGGNMLTLGLNLAQLGTLVYTGTNPSWVANGTFKRWYTGAQTIADLISKCGLPIGDNVEKFASIVFNVAPSSGGTLTASFVNQWPETAGLPLTQGLIDINRVGSTGYWNIITSDGLNVGTGNYDIYLLANQFVGVSDLSQLVLVKRDDNLSDWSLEGTHITTMDAATLNPPFWTAYSGQPLLVRSGLNTFSQFGVGGDSTINELPIILTSFSAQNIGSNNVLDWTINSNSKISKITVLKSFDGFTFENAYSQNNMFNSWIDYNANSHVFYKLKIENLDGESFNSRIIEIIKLQKNTISLIQLNNPKLNIKSENESSFSYSIIDLNGRILKTYSNTIFKGENTITFEDFNISSGIYILNGTLDNQEFTFKIYFE